MDLITLGLAKKYSDEQIQKAQFGGVSVDTSLSQAGIPADAKAVGDALANRPDESRVKELITQEFESMPFAEEASF